MGNLEETIERPQEKTRDYENAVHSANKHLVRIVKLEKLIEEATERLETQEADIALLWGSLAGLVGASKKAELEKMEAAIRLMKGSETDKTSALNAIHALLDPMLSATNYWSLPGVLHPVPPPARCLPWCLQSRLLLDRQSQRGQ
jgi:hypothetical protein